MMITTPQFLSHEEIARLADAAKDELHIEVNGPCFAAGGLVTGLSHAHSDLDIYLVTNVPAPAKTITRIDQIAVQYNFVTCNEFSAATDLLDAYEVMPGDLTGMERFDTHQKLLSRYVTAVPLYGTAEAHPSHRNTYRRTQIAYQTFMAARMLEDCEGARRVDNAPIARFAALRAVQHALEAALAAGADYNFGDALLLARLERSSLLKPAQSTILKTLGILPTASTAEIHDACVLANGLLVDAVLNGWDTPAQELVYTQIAATDPTAVVLDPVVLGVRFAQDELVGILAPDRGMRSNIHTFTDLVAYGYGLAVSAHSDKYVARGLVRGVRNT